MKPTKESLRIQQLEINELWLISRLDEIHTALCPGQVGTHKQRVEQAVKAARKIARPAPSEESDLHVDAMRVLEFLNKACGKSFRPVASTLSLIKARLKEPGVTVLEIERMIIRQRNKWQETNMEEYLRPSTLFRASKFENYYIARDLPLSNQPKPQSALGYDEA